MKPKAAPGPKAVNIERFHQELVEKLVPAAVPVKPISPVWAQWLVWLALSLGIVYFFLTRYGPQDNVSQVFRQFPPLAFLAAIFLGAAFSAWQAVASSVPGRQTGKAALAFTVAVLAALVLMPFLFFYHPGEGFDPAASMTDGTGCVDRVALTGLLPWLILGRMVSGNASFHPVRTGVWSGVSAFLLGLVAVQLHCPLWDYQHILVGHLLPVALLTVPAAVIGSFWFSRWHK